MFLIFQWQWRIRIVNLECIMICKWHFAKFIFATNSRHKKSRKWFFICVLTQQFLFPSFLCITNRQKFFLLQKFNLTEFFVVVWWVYSVLTFQLDKLVKMSNNKNNRWIFWAPLDDAATKQKAHILVEMDARVSIYDAMI